MDTIIDTRKFPKEMQEQPREERQGKENGFWKAFFLWLFFILLVAGIVLFFFRMKKQGKVVSREEMIQRENATIDDLLKEKAKPVAKDTHERMVQHFFKA